MEIEQPGWELVCCGTRMRKSGTGCPFTLFNPASEDSGVSAQTVKDGLSQIWIISIVGVPEAVLFFHP